MYNLYNGLQSVHMSILACMSGNFLIVNADGMAAFVSQGFLQLTGIDEEALVGKPLGEALKKELAKRFFNYIYAAESTLLTAQNTLQVSYAEAHSRLDGLTHARDEVYYWKVSSTPVLEDGKLAYLVHTIEDHTAHYLASYQLKDYEERNQMLWESDTILIWDYNVRTGQIHRNKGVYTTLGLEQERVDKELWYELLHPDDKDFVLSSLTYAMQAEATVWQAEYRLRHKAGHYVTVSDWASIAYTETGEAYRIVGVILNMSQLRSTQQSLLLEMRRFEYLIQSIPAIAWLCDGDGSTTFANKWYESLTARDAESLKGEGWLDILHPDDRETVLESWHESAKAGRAWNGTCRVYDARLDGYKWHSCKAMPVEDERGVLHGWVGFAMDIDEQQQTALEIEQQRNSLKQMLDALPIMAWAAHPAGNTTYYNKEWFRYFEGSHQEWTTEQWVALMHPDDRQMVISSWSHSLSTGAPYRCKLRWQPYQGGPYRWFLAQASPVYNPDGQISYWMGSTTDVHRFEEEQALLKQKYEFLELVLDALPYAAFAVTPAMETLYCNQHWSTVFNLHSMQEIDAHWPSLIHPEDKARTMEQLDKVYASGKRGSIEYRLRPYQEDTYRWYYGQTQPVYNKDGTIDMWIGTIVDINDQKLMHKALEQDVAEFRFLSDLVPHLVWRTDPEGFHDFFNQQWVEYTGYTVEDSLGTEMWNNLLHPDDQQRARRVWSRSLETGEPYEIEYRFKRASDGMWRWFLARALPLRDENGAIIKWYGTCTDIHDQKQLLQELTLIDEELNSTNQALAEKNKQLERINQDLDIFVHAASHDLRAPINNLEGLIRILQASAREVQQVEIIGMMAKSVFRLRDTITDLAEVIKFEYDGPALMEAISIEESLKNVEADLKPLIESSSTRFVISLQVEQIRFSRKYLRSLFYNLISNAIKFRSEKRSPVIGISSTQEGSWVKLEVSDNGMGIQEKDYDKVFSIFKRLHTHIEGTGVGMHLLKKMIDGCGGRIELSSRVDVGTTFTIYLPQH